MTLFLKERQHGHVHGRLNLKPEFDITDGLGPGAHAVEEMLPVEQRCVRLAAGNDEALALGCLSEFHLRRPEPKPCPPSDSARVGQLPVGPFSVTDVNVCAHLCRTNPTPPWSQGAGGKRSAFGCGWNCSLDQQRRRPRRGKTVHLTAPAGRARGRRRPGNCGCSRSRRAQVPRFPYRVPADAPIATPSRPPATSP